MKTTILLFFIFLVLIIPVLAEEMANPASVHCIDQGYETKIRVMEDGTAQFGVCIFEDSECEEWEYMREECKPGECEGKIVGYFECREDCEKTEEGCCRAKFRCEEIGEETKPKPFERPKPRPFAERFKEWIKYIFIWLWFEEDEKEKSSFEKSLTKDQIEY